MTNLRKYLCLICISSTLLLSGCAPAPPHNKNNICKMFRQYPKWYWTAKSVRKEYHLRISVLMAIIYQESRFQAGAAPPRERLLWIIPWKRPTSAYGYSQAVRGTWDAYKRDTGHHYASRDEFSDAAYFIGWFTRRAHFKAGIPMTNAYELYLAYHEGVGGYQSKTYLRKHWLIEVARHVQSRAWMYRQQLLRCEASLPQKPWWRYII